ncbi:hypothetical protein SBV1_2990007 [Verrucomicrobia bacterium]|nr:hypothetical protein SBV1_2990007 [Verrucomicrobiota bacterium]
MRYVIIRDDDTNALTPVDCLDRLYRPFLESGLPVNLAVIPEVATATRMNTGQLEGFLRAGYGSQEEIDEALAPSPLPSNSGEVCRSPRRGADVSSPQTPVPPANLRGLSKTANADPWRRTRGLLPFTCPGGSAAACGDETSPPLAAAGQMLDAHPPEQERENVRRSTIEPTSTRLPIGTNRPLVSYLLDHAGYHVVQHGCRHDYLEFDKGDGAEMARRLDRGRSLLREAGLGEPNTFVAPYDRLSSASLLEVAKRFSVLSSGWYELRRLPYSWWPSYALKKTRRADHWKVGRTLLLTHPGCLLSCHRPYDTMLDTIIAQLKRQSLTVVVTHWWEYFRDGRADETFINLLHETCDYLGRQPDLKVVAFSDLAEGKVPINL